MSGVIPSTIRPGPLPPAAPIVLQSTRRLSWSSSVVSDTPYEGGKEEEGEEGTWGGEATRQGATYKEIERLVNRDTADMAAINKWVASLFDGSRSEQEVDNIKMFDMNQYEEDIEEGRRKNTLAWRILSKKVSEASKRRRERRHARIDAEDSD